MLGVNVQLSSPGSEDDPSPTAVSDACCAALHGLGCFGSSVVTAQPLQCLALCVWCTGRLVCVAWHAMDVASRASDAQWFAEPCDRCKEELRRRTGEVLSGVLQSADVCQ